MKLKIKVGDLLASLKAAQRVVERRNTIPILANVALVAAEKALIIKSTDLDIMASTIVGDVAIAQEGSTTVGAHILYDFVGKLPQDGEIAFGIDEKTQAMKISCGRARLNLHTIPFSDFPSLDTTDLSHEFKVNGDVFVRSMKKAQFAISTEETRYYLNGVYLHVLGKELLAVATDGHRLAKVIMEAPAGAKGMPGVIVPRKTVSQLIQLGAGVESIGVALSDKRIKFDFGATVLSSKVIDGTFPDYSRVVPTGNTKVATIDRGAAFGAVSRVSTVSSERGRAVKFAFNGATELELSVKSADTGNADEKLEVAFEGDPIDIGFNSRYMLDIVHQLEGEAFTMAMADPGSPTIFTSTTDKSAIYVCMPLRV
jgi:DNA polymerase III subunit beta